LNSQAQETMRLQGDLARESATNTGLYADIEELQMQCLLQAQETSRLHGNKVEALERRLDEGIATNVGLRMEVETLQAHYRYQAQETSQLRDTVKTLERLLAEHRTSNVGPHAEIEELQAQCVQKHLQPQPSNPTVVTDNPLQPNPIVQTEVSSTCDMCSRTSALPSSLSMATAKDLSPKDTATHSLAPEAPLSPSPHFTPHASLVKQEHSEIPGSYPDPPRPGTSCTCDTCCRPPVTIPPTIASPTDPHPPLLPEQEHVVTPDSDSVPSASSTTPAHLPPLFSAPRPVNSVVSFARGALTTMTSVIDGVLG